MSHVSILTDPSYPLSSFNPSLALGLATTKTKSLDSLAVLGDRCANGLVPAWAKMLAEAGVDAVPSDVRTTGFNSVTLTARNEALLPPKATTILLVFGAVVTSSEAHVLGRAFAIPAIHVCQIIDGKAALVGTKNIVCAPGVEITTPKPLDNPGAHRSGVNPLAAWAAKPSKAKK